MAVKQEVGQYYQLSIGDGGSPEAFTPVACLTNKEFTRATKVIDGTSDCGPLFKPGFGNTTMQLTGFVDYADAAALSGMDLFTLSQDGTIFNFMIDPVDSPVTGDQTFTGTGFISSYKQTFQTDTLVGFDVSLQITGELTQTVF